MNELNLKKPIGIVVGVVCAGIALSAVAGMTAALLASRPLWFMCGFEVVTLVAGVVGVLIAMGKFGDGPGLALLCVMGAVVVGSVLGDLSTQLANPMGGPVVRHLGGTVDVPITMFMVARLAAAGVVGLCGAWVVLARRPGASVSSLARGVGSSVLLMALVLGAWKLRSHWGGLGTLTKTLGALGMSALALGLLAAAVHFTIRAFEFGRLPDEGMPRGG